MSRKSYGASLATNSTQFGDHYPLVYSLLKDPNCKAKPSASLEKSWFPNELPVVTSFVDGYSIQSANDPEIAAMVILGKQQRLVISWLTSFLFVSHTSFLI